MKRSITAILISCTLLSACDTKLTSSKGTTTSEGTSSSHSHLPPDYQTPVETSNLNPIEEITTQLFTDSKKIAPSNGTIAEEAFNQSEKIAQHKLPLYHTKVDSTSLNKAIDTLQNTYGTFHKVNRKLYVNGPDKIVVYTNGNKILRVNYSSGLFSFTDNDLYQKGEGVKDIDIELIQRKSNDIFNKYLGKKLKTAYLYRFRKFRTSSSNGIETQDHGIYEVALALNQTLNKLPIIGNGGKYSIHLKPDGTLVKADFHFVNFEKVPNSEVDIFGASIANQKLNLDLASVGVSTDNHKVTRSELGYFLSTSKGKQVWSVPTYAYFIEPLPGNMDKKRIFTYPASEDPNVVKAVKSDEAREENRKRLKLPTDDLKEDEKIIDPILSPQEEVINPTYQ